MLSRQENDLLTSVGPGTPCGEMLRRYWWPIGFSELVTEEQTPTKVRLLGEDFVLFRDGALRLGLLELHCSHRGTSLEFGRVEDQGIRCCYHGWLYDVAGRCLEQPAEPAESTFKDRIQHPAYKVQEIAGFIFAYLGPDPAPLLPRYDLFLAENGERVIGAGTEYCNWLQRAENSVDQTHLVALHAPEYPQMALKRPEIGWQKTVYGAKITMHVPGVSKPKHSHWVFPSHTRHTTARKDRVPDHAIRFRVPTDDTTTKTFWLRFTPNDEAHRDRPLRLKTVGLRTISLEFTLELTTAGGASRHMTKTASPRNPRVRFTIALGNTWALRMKALSCCARPSKNPSRPCGKDRILSGFSVVRRKTTRSPLTQVWPKSAP